MPRHTVLMSADDYDSWQETVYLLRSPENARRLMEAVARDKAGAFRARHVDQRAAGDGRRRGVRSVHFDSGAWEDFPFWLASDRKTARRIVRLIAEIQRDPFSGIGKPEPLKGELSGYWSRRVDDQHRLVYRADDNEIKVLKARYHY